MRNATGSICFFGLMLVLSAGNQVYGSAILSLSDLSGTSQTTAIDANRNFTAKVGFASDTSKSTSVVFILDSMTQVGTGTAFANKFQIVSRTAGTAFPSADPSDASVVGHFLNMATPTVAPDFHGFDVTNPQTTSNPTTSLATPYNLATFVIKVDPTVPNGTYQLKLATDYQSTNYGNFTDDVANTLPFTNFTNNVGTANSILTVTVPEPTGVLGLAVGIWGMIMRRGRRLRNTSSNK
jgi:hypothetical protein